MSNRLTIQVRVSSEDKELFLFKSRNSGFNSIGTWLKWLAKNAPIVESDIHKETATQLFDVDSSEISKEQRDFAKNVDYMSLYGSDNPKLTKLYEDDK